MSTTTPTLPVRLLHTAYPCCGRKSTFPVEAARYLRKCPTCGARWRVLRTTSAPTDFSRRLGVRLDRLEWQRR